MVGKRAFLESIGANERMGFGQYRSETIAWVWFNRGPNGCDWGTPYVEYARNKFTFPNFDQARALHVWQVMEDHGM
jgi:hypothetical protein